MGERWLLFIIELGGSYAKNHKRVLDMETYQEHAAGAIGQRSTMNDPSGNTAWQFDQRGRVITETKTIYSSAFITAWEYNSANLVKKMKYPDGEEVNYTYHPQLTINSVAGLDTYVKATVYDAAGRVDLRELGLSSGQAVVKTDYGYNPWTQQGGRLQTLKSGTPGDAISLQYLEYDYDSAGNVNWIKDYKAGGTQTHSFTYDALDRLTSASASGGQFGFYSESYSYDSNTGNLSFKTGIGSYTYDTNHKHAVASTSNGWSFGYDANGNMTQRTVNGQTHTLGYDAEGQLVSVSGTSLSAQFTYDGDGKRVKSIINNVTTYFVGNYYEVSGSTVKKSYYAGTQRVAMRENGTLSYILSDHLGSTSVIANDSGTYQSEQRYKAWGEIRYTSGTLPTCYQYTGQYSYTPEFGLYFYNARWYDPNIMLFTSPDTLIPDYYDPLQWNRYAYSRFNPVKYTDPSGHFPQVFIGAAIGAIAGVTIVAITHSNLQTSDFLQAAMVGAAAGALISTGVGAGAATALGATLIGAGVGTATSAAGYTLTAGTSYDSDEMTANALIGGATGAATAITGPAIVGSNMARSGAAVAARASVNALGTQVSQIIHNEFFDEGIYPSGGELTGAAGLGAGASSLGEVADKIVNGIVLAISGNQAVGRVAGSVAYNLVRNSLNSYYVNKGLNFIDWAAENSN